MHKEISTVPKSFLCQQTLPIIMIVMVMKEEEEEKRREKEGAFPDNSTSPNIVDYPVLGLPPSKAQTTSWYLVLPPPIL